MGKINRHQIIAASLALAVSRSELQSTCYDKSADESEVKNKWRGGSRGKGGKTKWPRR